MLVGQHTHKLDDKGRLSLPSKFRKELGKTVIVTHGLDKCLSVYSTQQWKHFSTAISELSMGQANSRAFTRFMLAGAVDVDIDKSGRILIPDHLRSYADLSEQIIVTGVHNRLELWSNDVWDTYMSGVSKQADTLAEKLGEIGMI